MNRAIWMLLLSTNMVGAAANLASCHAMAHSHRMAMAWFNGSVGSASLIGVGMCIGGLVFAARPRR